MPSPLTSGTSVPGTEPNTATTVSGTAPENGSARRDAVQDRIDLSASAQALTQSGPRTSNPPSASQKASNAGSKSSGAQGELTEAEQKQVQELKKRDQEVRTHEQAHQRVGGQYASAPTYEYQKGPDGRSYAVGGQVQIDSSAIPGDPDATIEKMRIVKAAALAPAEPSAQDRKVASAADSTAQQAQAEKMQMEREEREAMLEGEAGSEPSQGLKPTPGVEPASGIESSSESDSSDERANSSNTSEPGALPDSGNEAAAQASPFERLETTQTSLNLGADEDAETAPNAPETGFSGGIEAQSALMNQANGAYTTTTRAQSVSQITGLVA